MWWQLAARQLHKQQSALNTSRLFHKRYTNWQEMNIKILRNLPKWTIFTQTINESLHLACVYWLLMAFCRLLNRLRPMYRSGVPLHYSQKPCFCPIMPKRSIRYHKWIQSYVAAKTFGHTFGGYVWPKKNDLDIMKPLVYQRSGTVSKDLHTHLLLHGIHDPLQFIILGVLLHGKFHLVTGSTHHLHKIQ